jgi:cardiolipin synthase
MKSNWPFSICADTCKRDARPAEEEQLKLISQPGDSVTALLNAINNAERSVAIAIFRFTHRGLEHALLEAVRRGVPVSALIAHTNGSDPDALRKLEIRLIAAGVKVARTDGSLARYHSKYMIIDEKELFVLAFNYTHQDIDQSRSFGLVIKYRKLVCEATKLFEADVMRQPYKPASSSLVVSPLNARKQLSSFIRGAKKDLAIYDPRISDSAILRLLHDRVKAGVSVRVIGRMNGKQADIAVRQLENLRLHTRSIVRDGEILFIGSQSLREHELDRRRELGVICRDRAAVAGVIKVFEEDWAGAKPVAERQLKRRPLVKIAKKVGKAVSQKLPSVAPILEDVLEAPDTVPELQIPREEIDLAVRQAVKHAVKEVIEQAIEQ